MRKITFAGGMSICWAVWIVWGCGQEAKYVKNQAHAAINDEVITQGKALAGKFCGSCHQLPTPDLLDAGSWEKGVLPQMGPRLGIFSYMNQAYPNNSADPHVGRGFYPAEPLLSQDEWGALMAYYTALAPDSLPHQVRAVPIIPDTSLFEVRRPDVLNGPDAKKPVGVMSGGPAGVSGTAGAKGSAGMIPGMPPATCFIRYDSTAGEILTSDVLRHDLQGWGKGLKPLNGLLMGGAAVDMVPDSNNALICNIGAFGPNNAPAGHIDQVELGAQGIGVPPATIFDSLLRPVNMACADLNGDGRKDLVVCEFGYIKGELSWLENKGGGHYEKHVLRSTPGAIRVIVQDYNHDHLPDIWVLFAQGDEGIVLYTNKGGGVFSEQQVLRFPPCYGSTYFELDDFDRDGQPDILYTCGDNGDFSTVLKPYHGVYIFRNEGNGRFVQKYFYPINGCYKAMARDFKGNGSLDIASIAYFADFAHQPGEGFVYLKRSGDWQFSPYSIPGTEQGRWMVMDVADVDGDGHPDLLLGNCSVGPGFNKGKVDWKKGPPFVWLRNRQ